MSDAGRNGNAGAMEGSIRAGETSSEGKCKSENGWREKGVSALETSNGQDTLVTGAVERWVKVSSIRSSSLVIEEVWSWAEVATTEIG